MKYTYKDLKQDIVNINLHLSYVTDLHFDTNKRNGYVGLDLYDNKGMIDNLACGTPKECMTVLFRFAFNIITEDK